MTSNDDRDRILAELLCGDLAADDPRALELFETDPDARMDLEELREIESALVQGSESASDVIAESRRIERAPGEALVRATLLQQSSRQAGAWYRARRWLIPLAACAALLLAWSRMQHAELSEGDELQGDEQLMGPSDVELRAPLGGVEQYAPFTWTGELEDGGWFEVWVYNANLLDADAFLESGTLLQPSWSPSTGPAPWPSRIRWTVGMYGSSGNMLESRSGDAWLLP